MAAPVGAEAARHDPEKPVTPLDPWVRTGKAIERCCRKSRFSTTSAWRLLRQASMMLTRSGNQSNMA